MRTRRALPSRRAVLGAGVLTTIGCTPTPTQEDPVSSTTRRGSGRVLMAYFSRAGENYYYYGGRRDLEVGNTAVVAETIARFADVDLHEMRAAEPYPTTTTRRSSATPVSRTPTPARASPGPSRTSPATTSSCSAAASGACTSR